MGIFKNIAARTPHLATDKKVDKSGIYVILTEAFQFSFTNILIRKTVCMKSVPGPVQCITLN
jgi:hypothetical protein